jgi:hypothetical protein
MAWSRARQVTTKEVKNGQISYVSMKQCTRCRDCPNTAPDRLFPIFDMENEHSINAPEDEYVANHFLRTVLDCRPMAVVRSSSSSFSRPRLTSSALLFSMIFTLFFVARIAIVFSMQ